MGVQSQIISKYGVPSKDYRDKYCEIWNISDEFKWTENIRVGNTQAPWKRIYINKEFKSKLRIAFRNLELLGVYKEIKTYNGCYVERNVRGKNAISLHSWAMAIDFNSETEALNQKVDGKFHSNFSAQFIKCFVDAGIYWGGNWKSRFDPMHFALYNG
jgi:hypothetical protein